MIIQSVALTQFRNHHATSVRLAPHLNVLLGSNGQGKTNILEALSYVGLTKSFYAAGEKTVVEVGTSFFRIEATLEADTGRRDTVEVMFDADTGEKVFTINRVRPDRLAEVIGRFPTVVLSPEHEKITAGSPADRRRWMDLLLSQINPAYLEELIEYRRILHQRNALLLDARLIGRPVADAIEPWTESLVRGGAGLMERRQRFVDEFVPAFRKAYAALAPGSEQADIAYVPSCAAETGGAAALSEHAFRAALLRRSGEEIRRGSTLVGPHRDDLAFHLTGLRLQDYASQGQQKTFLVALKIAEFAYLQEQRQETPVFLLDDLFGELDIQRAAAILGRLENAGQCVITATDERVFGGAVRWGERNGRFLVEEGTCRAF